MTDDEVLHHITHLVNEEHELTKLAEEHNGLDEDQRARLHELEVRLDQCWDLLRQRRARRHAGQDPDAAAVRDAAIVEHYKQ
jgi:Protein of unknown function (DUF2630)